MNKWVNNNNKGICKCSNLRKIEWNLRENYIKTQLTFTCSKLTIETLEQGVKYI